MKRILAALCVTCVLALAVHAQDTDTKKKHEPSAAMKELLEKYDANKDGKLEKDEIAKMTAEDKATYEKIHKAHVKKEHEEKKDAGTNAPSVK